MMLSTYKAVLRGDRLEWSTDAPKLMDREDAVPVYVTLLDEPTCDEAQSSRGQRMAEALEQLAEIHAVAEMQDAAGWERDTRHDRSLPDREI
ncbi:MAG: hypothetical protein V1792_18360 [Pseudomonadota bacterium]